MSAVATPTRKRSTKTTAARKPRPVAKKVVNVEELRVDATSEALVAETKANAKKAYNDVKARIVAMRKSGSSYPSIAKQLNEEAVDTCRGKGTWYAPQIRSICLAAGVERG